MNITFFVFLFCCLFELCYSSEESYSSSDFSGSSREEENYGLSMFNINKPLPSIPENSLLPLEDGDETTSDDTTSSEDPSPNAPNSQIEDSLPLELPINRLQSQLKRRESFNLTPIESIIKNSWNEAFLKKIMTNNISIQRLQPTLPPLKSLKKIPPTRFQNKRYWNIHGDETLEDMFDYPTIEKIINLATQVFSSQINPSIKKDLHKYSNVYLQRAQLFSKDDYIYTFGDPHGGFFSIIPLLHFYIESGTIHPESPFDENLVLKPEHRNAYYVGLGDYVDGGHLNTETLILLLVLAIKNPENFILVRGNHESGDLNEIYGFKNELKHRFGEQIATKLSKLLEKLYESMPVVFFPIFKGETNTYYYYVLCHGGIEPEQKVDPFIDLCEQAIEKKIAYSSLTIDDSNKTGTTCKYQWGDVTRHSSSNCYLIDEEGNPATRPAYNEKTIRDWFNKQSTETIKGIGLLRGHQHCFFYNKKNSGDSNEPEDEDEDDEATNLTDIMLANYNTAYHWKRDDVLVITLGPSPSSGFGIAFENKTSFHESPPGVVGISSGIIYDNGTVIALVRLPNQYLSYEHEFSATPIEFIPLETIKLSAKIYTKFLIQSEQLLDSKYELTDDQKDFLFYLINEYKQLTGKSIRSATKKELKKFIKNRFRVSQPEIFARFTKKPNTLGLQQDLSGYILTQDDFSNKTPLIEPENPTIKDGKQNNPDLGESNAQRRSTKRIPTLLASGSVLGLIAFLNAPSLKARIKKFIQKQFPHTLAVPVAHNNE